MIAQTPIVIRKRYRPSFGSRPRRCDWDGKDESEVITVHSNGTKIQEIVGVVVKVLLQVLEAELSKDKGIHPQVEKEDDESLVQNEQIRRAHEDRSRSRLKESRKRERQAAISQFSNMEDLHTARVIGAEGAFFVVRVENGQDLRAKTYKSTRTSNINSTLVAIGDEVRVSVKLEEVSIIEEVLPRRTKLSRKA